MNLACCARCKCSLNTHELICTHIHPTHPQHFAGQAGRLAAIDATRCVYGPDDAAHHLWSINVVAFCADHCMAAVNIDGWRGLLGTARYDVCAMWGLLKGRQCAVDIVIDGTKWQEGIGAMFVNTTQHFGKGMRAAPSAQVDDGKCDVISLAGSRFVRHFHSSVPLTLVHCSSANPTPNPTASPTAIPTAIPTANPTTVQSILGRL